MFRKLKRSIKQKLFSISGNNARVRILRSDGAKIGDNCLINTYAFSTEPYLVEIGNNVAVSGNTLLDTHDGAVRLFRNKYPGIDIFGKIVIGDNSFVGVNCIILPNTTIGKNCIIGAGSVVRGTIPDNSVVMGNPAKVIAKTEIYEKLYRYNKNALFTKGLDLKEKKEVIKNHFKIQS